MPRPKCQLAPEELSLSAKIHDSRLRVTGRDGQCAVSDPEGSVAGGRGCSEHDSHPVRAALSAGAAAAYGADSGRIRT